MQGPSAQKENILISTIKKVIDNKISSALFAQELETAKKHLIDTKKDFNMVVASQNDEIRKACKNIIAHITSLFDQYEETLDEATGYIHGFDKAILMPLPEKIETVSRELDRAFFDFRQVSLQALGPTTFPGINLLIDTARRIIKGEELEQKLKTFAEQEGMLIEDVLTEVEKQEKTRENLLLIDLYNEFLEIFQGFYEYLDYKEPEVLEETINELIQASREFKNLDNEIDIKKMSEGPTSSPLANLVFNCARKLKEGQLDMEVFDFYLQQFWDQTENMRFKINTLKRNPAESATVEEETEIVWDALHYLEEALSAYFDFAEKKDPELLKEAEDKLKGAIQEMEESKKIFGEISQSEGKIPCAKCGAFNLPGNKYCAKCNAILPKIAAVEKTTMEFTDAGKAIGEQGAVMTSNVNELFELADKVLSSQAQPEEILILLEQFHKRLETAHQAAGPLPKPSREEIEKMEPAKYEMMKKGLLDAKKMYIEGLEDFEVGLTFFEQFARTLDSNALEAGKQQIWTGMEKLQQVTEPFNPEKK